MNLGSVSAGWLKAAGIQTPEELRAVGAVVAFRRVAMHRGGAGVTYNLLYALEGALRGIRWDRLPVALRDELKRAADAPPA